MTLTDKYRAWAEIDLDALLLNHRAVKKLLPGGEKLCAVVKADAYGHGAVTVARALEEETDFFAVAMAEEAFELRDAGIKKPILILGIVPHSRVRDLVTADVRLTVTSLREAKAIAGEAKKAGKEALLHLAVDTGMGRIGFLPNEKSVNEIAELSRLREVVIEGVFSHFATADEPDPSFAAVQQERFERFLAALRERGICPPVRHLFNSAAILRRAPAFDMAREGLVLYGLTAEGVERDRVPGLRPVMSVKARIVQIKTLPKGSPVSYGSTFVTGKRTKVATVSMGYGDGLPRALSNGGEALVRGICVPILGRVCMDQLMLDVTGIGGLREGECAVLFGFDGEAELPVTEQAKRCGTISYELLCNINRRVPRVYIKNGRIVGIASLLPEN